jgi:hypothetical protein
LPARYERSGIGPEPGSGFGDDQAVQHVLTGRVDDVEQHDEHSDPEQIPVPGDQLESAFRP